MVKPAQQGDGDGRCVHDDRRADKRQSDHSPQRCGSAQSLPSCLQFDSLGIVLKGTTILYIVLESMLHASLPTFLSPPDHRPVTVCMWGEAADIHRCSYTGWSRAYPDHNFYLSRPTRPRAIAGVGNSSETATMRDVLFVLYTLATPSVFSQLVGSGQLGTDSKFSSQPDLPPFPPLFAHQYFTALRSGGTRRVHETSMRLTQL